MEVAVGQHFARTAKMKEGKQRADSSPGRDGSRAGFTLVEVMIASATLAAVFGGLVASGIMARRMAEHLRLSTEARAFGKLAMETLCAVGRETLADENYTGLHSRTNVTSLGYEVTREVSVHWHNADTTQATAASNTYAEVVVRIEYDSPLNDTPMVDTITRLVP